MNEISKLEYSYELLSPSVKSAVLSIPIGERECISELRLRLGMYLSAVLYGKEYFVTYDGKLKCSADNAVNIGESDIKYTFTHAFEGSVHAFPKELAQGYITCGGGNRVGFCGTAVLDPKSFNVISVKNISSVNIRIAREVIGCAKLIYEKAFSSGAASLIIASPPCGGKTTVLRDLCRILSDTYRVSVIDERGEIACMHNGMPQNNVGLRTDVFNAYGKSDAAATAVRVMSPQILVCDEIGAKEDLRSLEYAVNSGVRLVCTCHASSFDELKKRPSAGRLLKAKAFDYAAMLGTASMCGKLTAFYKLKEC